MSSFASAATASAATPAAPPKLPTIEQVHPGCTTTYDLTLYKFRNVSNDYSVDDREFFNKFVTDPVAPFNYLHALRDTINSRDNSDLSDDKKKLCNDWINGVSIQKNDTTTNTNLRNLIGNDICGIDMDSAFLTNRHADLKKTPNVGVLVMLVTINITTPAKVIVFPVFCLSFSILRIDIYPVLVINGVCTNKRYSDGCPLYAFLFYKAVEHCISTFTGIQVITILSALVEAVSSYLRSGFDPRNKLNSKDKLRKFMRENLTNYGSDFSSYIIDLAISKITPTDPTGMLNPAVIAANNAFILAPVTTLLRKPSNNIPNMHAERERVRLQVVADAAAAQLMIATIQEKARHNFETREQTREQYKKQGSSIRAVRVGKKYKLKKHDPMGLNTGGRTKKNKKISRKRTFTSKNRKNKKHRKQKTKRR